MQQTAAFITVATADLNASRAFYMVGLQWEPLLDVPDEIIFFQIAPGTVLSLYDATHFQRDMGETGAAALSGITLSQNVSSRDEVDALVAETLAAGAALIKRPQVADFGGYHAHIADPNGLIWEICHNPGWSVGADGMVQLAPVEPGPDS